MRKMKVSVIGTGYVGLVSGVCLAEKGHQVVCVDVDQAKVDTINNGIPPIYERGLEELLQRNIQTSLTATTDIRRAILDTELSIVAVGTPFDGHEIDLKYIRIVAQEIGSILKDKAQYHVVVIKSTVVPGTTDDVVIPILEHASLKKAGEDFGVGMNPEFLREGDAISDFMNPDRIVLGGIDKRSLDAMDNLYGELDHVDKIHTNPKTAEMIKYTANSLLATLISFSNEIGNLCATVGVDVVDVMHATHLDNRFSPIRPDGERVFPAMLTYLAAGCGFGGSCFPKDVKALIQYGQKVGSPMKILQSVIKVNAQQPKKMLEILRQNFPDISGLEIAVLGVAFKPGTDDIRESPAIPVIQALLREKAVVRAYDPVARHEAEKLFGKGVDFRGKLKEAIEGASVILIMTRWEEFQGIPGLLVGWNQQPLVIDGRRMLEKKCVSKYEGIGLGATSPAKDPKD